MLSYYNRQEVFGYGYKGVGLRKTSMLIPTPPEAPGYVNHPPWSDLQTGELFSLARLKQSNIKYNQSFQSLNQK